MSNTHNNQVQEEVSFDREGGEVATLLTALPRVEAPANFEFGVKAKIAAANAATPRASFVPFAKVAAPLALVLAVAAGLVYYGTLPVQYNAGVNPAPSVEQDTGQGVEDPRTADRSQQPSGPDVGEEIIQQPERVSVPTRDPRRVRNAGRNAVGVSVDEPFASNSTERSVTQPPVIIQPEFRSANPDNRGTVGSGNEIPVRDVLEILGINAAFVEGGWKVSSANANSTAEKAGVRASDVLEAIDNQALTEKTTFKGSFSPKVLRVKRDGKAIDLSLRAGAARPSR